MGLLVQDFVVHNDHENARLDGCREEWSCLTGDFEQKFQLGTINRLDHEVTLIH
jgi:hypothetical protein